MAAHMKVRLFWLIKLILTSRGKCNRLSSRTSNAIYDCRSPIECCNCSIIESSGYWMKCSSIGINVSKLSDVSIRLLALSFFLYMGVVSLWTLLKFGFSSAFYRLETLGSAGLHTKDLTSAHIQLGEAKIGLCKNHLKSSIRQMYLANLLSRWAL